MDNVRDLIEDVSLDHAPELEPTVLGPVSEITAGGGDTSPDFGSIVWTDL